MKCHAHSPMCCRWGWGRSSSPILMALGPPLSPAAVGRGEEREDILFPHSCHHTTDEEGQTGASCSHAPQACSPLPLPAGPALLSGQQEKCRAFSPQCCCQQGQDQVCAALSSLILVITGAAGDMVSSSSLGLGGIVVLGRSVGYSDLHGPGRCSTFRH